MPHLFTTHGALRADQVGMILPHEHIFVDLRTPDVAEQDETEIEASDVVALMRPELEKIKYQGVTVLVECTPEGVGRRPDLVNAVAQAADFPVVVPTGIYREPWVPDWALLAMEEDLASWMRRELTNGFQGLDFKAGFIKLSAGDDGMTEAEKNILRAAITASKATNAVIGSHTINAFVVEQQLAVMKELDFDPERFIWIHAQVDTLETNLRLAPLGLWIEYDHIDGTEEGDAEIIRRMQALVAAGYEDKILLSMDRGWYDPGQPGGGIPQPFTLLGEVFLPKLKGAGFSEAQIHKFTVTNPFNAFAR